MIIWKSDLLGNLDDLSVEALWEEDHHRLRHIVLCFYLFLFMGICISNDEHRRIADTALRISGYRSTKDTK